MDRRVTPPRPVTSLTWDPPTPCKQALRMNGMHRAYSGQALLDLLSLVTRGQARALKLNSFTRDVPHIVPNLFTHVKPVNVFVLT